ncbi:hypothetical protein ACFSJ3_15990 [Corallincola platygyrae]|uniref:DUF7716 domain-containing protein n=1 Tax=Corallincola platygyrae TaxID=1193278 RepID=A0ABW4XQ98_9GAMM
MRLEQPLEVLIGSIDELPWDHQLYVLSSSLANYHEMALVLDDDAELERDQHDEPAFASSKGYQYFMSIADLQEVKRNLVSRESGSSLQRLIDAILYYHKNDAFIR